jgi:hypothetical protein
VTDKDKDKDRAEGARATPDVVDLTGEEEGSGGAPSAVEGKQDDPGESPSWLIPAIHFISFPFILFHSHSFYFIPIHFISFPFILFHSHSFYFILFHFIQVC